jgi:hypothetical protein
MEVEESRGHKTKRDENEKTTLVAMAEKNELAIDPFEVMNDDTLFEVLDYLNPAEICKANQVSKKWNAFGQSKKIKQKIYDGVDRIFEIFTQAINQKLQDSFYLTSMDTPRTKAARNLLMSWRFASDQQKLKMRQKLLTFALETPHFAQIMSELIKDTGDQEFIPLLNNFIFSVKNENIFDSSKSITPYYLTSLKHLSHRFPKYHRTETISSLEKLLPSELDGFYAAQYLLQIDPENEKALERVRAEVTTADRFESFNLSPLDRPISKKIIPGCAELLRHDRDDELARKTLESLLESKTAEYQLQSGALLLSNEIYSPALTVVTQVLSGNINYTGMTYFYLDLFLDHFSLEAATKLARTIRKYPNSELTHMTHQFLSVLREAVKSDTGFREATNRERVMKVLAQFGQDL